MSAVLEKITPGKIDFIIFTDPFSVKNSPHWRKRNGGILYRYLERVARRQYNLKNDVEPWQHPSQTTRFVDGNFIYEFLNTENVFDRQLGYSDLLAIQAKGVEVFRALFKGKKLFAWRSIVKNRGRSHSVPYLEERAGRLVINWCWLIIRWDENNVALQFKSL